MFNMTHQKRSTLHWNGASTSNTARSSTPSIPRVLPTFLRSLWRRITNVTASTHKLLLLSSLQEREQQSPGSTGRRAQLGLPDVGSDDRHVDLHRGRHHPAWTVPSCQETELRRIRSGTFFGFGDRWSARSAGGQDQFHRRALESLSLHHRGWNDWR